jgi:hypothetical protein
MRALRRSVVRDILWNVDGTKNCQYLRFPMYGGEYAKLEENEFGDRFFRKTCDVLLKWNIPPLGDLLHMRYTLRGKLTLPKSISAFEPEHSGSTSG